jgi:Zn-dependent peptidase ImmA (M78 family)
MDHHTRRRLVLAAASHAERMRMTCGINQCDAIDPIGIAQQRGCEVRYMSLPSLEGIYSPVPGPVIVVGSQRPAGRRAYTCAHELGHHEFRHGTRVEELIFEERNMAKAPDEFLADMFAAHLMMSQSSIRYALKVRGFDVKKIEPMQIFSMASFFGVGYTTLIDHLALTLMQINQQQRDYLKRVKPKDLKAIFGGEAQSEVFIADEFWRGRPVDMEVGDILVLQTGSILEDNSRLSEYEVSRSQPIFKAISRGYARAFHEGSGWSINIRIAPKQYEGLAQHRFLDDPEED